MRLDKNSLVLKALIAGTLFVLILACGKCNRSLGLRDDNVLEEVTEEVIEHQLGIEIDLSPESSE